MTEPQYAGAFYCTVANSEDIKHFCNSSCLPSHSLVVCQECLIGLCILQDVGLEVSLGLVQKNSCYALKTASVGCTGPAKAKIFSVVLYSNCSDAIRVTLILETESVSCLCIVILRKLSKGDERKWNIFLGRSTYLRFLVAKQGTAWKKS